MDPLARQRRSYAEPNSAGDESALQRPRLSAVPDADPGLPDRTAARKALTGVILGILSTVSWMIPWVGFPLGLYGLIEGIRARYASDRAPRAALAAIGLCTLGMTLAIADLVVAAYVGSSGRNPLSGIFLR